MTVSSNRFCDILFVFLWYLNTLSGVDTGRPGGLSEYLFRLSGNLNDHLRGGAVEGNTSSFLASHILTDDTDILFRQKHSDSIDVVVAYLQGPGHTEHTSTAGDFGNQALARDTSFGKLGKHVRQGRVGELAGQRSTAARGRQHDVGKCTGFHTWMIEGQSHAGSQDGSEQSRRVLDGDLPHSDIVFLSGLHRCAGTHPSVIPF